MVASNKSVRRKRHTLAHLPTHTFSHPPARVCHTSHGIGKTRSKRKDKNYTLKPETEAYWRNRHNAKIALLVARRAHEPVLPSTNPVSTINNNGAITALSEPIDAIQPPLGGPDPVVDGNNAPQPSHDPPCRTDVPSSPGPVFGDFGEDHGIRGNRLDYMSDDSEPAENHGHQRITPGSTMDVDNPPTLLSYGPSRSPITPPNTPNRSSNIATHLAKYNDAIRSPSIPRRMTVSPPHNTNLRRLEPLLGTMLKHDVEPRPPVTPTNLFNRQPNPPLFDTRQTGPPTSGNRYSTPTMNSPSGTPRRYTSSFFSSPYTPDEHGTVPHHTFNTPSSRRSLSTFPPVPAFSYPPFQPTTYTFSNTGSPSQLQRVATSSRTEPPDRPSSDVLDCNRMFERSLNLPPTFRTENILSPRRYQTVDLYDQRLTQPMNNMSMIRRDDRAIKMETRNPTGQTYNPKDFQPNAPNFTFFNARNAPPVTIEHSSSELGDMFSDFEFNSSSVQGNIAFDEKEIAKLLTAFRAQRVEECGATYPMSLKGISEIRKFRDKLLYMNLCLKCFRTELKDGGGKHALALLFERDTELVAARSKGVMKAYLDQSSPDQPTIIQRLASRLVNLQGFQEEYIQGSVNRGYLLEFCYECMHEDISIAFPDKVGVGRLEPVNITRARHNKTLAKIIKAWKPKLENVEQTLKNMKGGYKRLMSLLSSVFKDGKTMSLDDLLLFSYMLNCLGDWQCDVSAFKKITAAENIEATVISHIWFNRLSALRPKLQSAAIRWAGVGDTVSSLEEVRWFCDGESPPAVLSIPHISAQALLERYPNLKLGHIEFACSLPRGILTSYEGQLGFDRIEDITSQPNPRKWTSRWFGGLFG